MRDRLEALGRLWKKAPTRLRQTIVLLLGATVVVLGLALIVLPGPFTLPLLILGFAILGSEFAWAASALEKTKAGVAVGSRVAQRAMRAAAERGGRVVRRRDPG
ncbi:MAG TPA: PGPGW domain-containing protein [Acidimicrobiales bacterium]|nr:PGPGW domain-containing protein [Acidimicrobiales bacterium]